MADKANRCKRRNIKEGVKGCHMIGAHHGQLEGHHLAGHGVHRKVVVDGRDVHVRNLLESVIRFSYTLQSWVI